MVLCNQGIISVSVSDIVALELLCSISSFADFKKRGVKVVSLHFA